MAPSMSETQAAKVAAKVDAEVSDALEGADITPDFPLGKGDLLVACTQENDLSGSSAVNQVKIFKFEDESLKLLFNIIFPGDDNSVPVLQTQMISTEVRPVTLSP